MVFTSVSEKIEDRTLVNKKTFIGLGQDPTRRVGSFYTGQTKGLFPPSVVSCTDSRRVREDRLLPSWRPSSL